MSRAKRIVAALIAAIFFFAAITLSGMAFQKIIDFRKLERIPVTPIIGSTNGEVQLQGVVAAHNATLKAPYNQAECIYYLYLEEERYRDSDGKMQWRTIKQETQHIDFTLKDNSGAALVQAEQANDDTLQITAIRKLSTRQGDRRYTEHRIDLGDKITLFGWMQLTAHGAEINFTTHGDYLPIITTDTASKARSSIGWSAAVLLGVAITMLIFACYLLVYSLAVHRVLVFIGLSSICSLLLLVHVGWQSLAFDVTSGYVRATQQIERSTDLIESLLQTYDIKTTSPFAVDLPQSVYQNTLSERDKQRIEGWRLTSYQVRERFLKQISHFPESTYAHLKKQDTPPPVDLPPEQKQHADAQLAQFQQTQIQTNAWLIGIAFLITIGTAWLAFRFIRVKRMQENLPTSPISGVSFGLTETSGTLTADSQQATLKGPLSGLNCCWYHYLVKEKRNSGKKEKWVTIENKTQQQSFYCTDGDASLRVFPKDAEIITQHKTTRRSGNLRYIEKRLSPGDTLYLLGKASIDEERGDTLVLAAAKNVTFIISNLPERAVMLIKAAKGMALLAACMSLLFFIQVLIAGSTGGFSSMDFLLAATTAPLFMVFMIFILMFNDLVFLQQRSQRAWANIQVSLKKRATLIPQLESVMKAIMSHEKKLLTHLTELRKQSYGDTDGASEFLQREHQLLDEMHVKIEAYPELKANTSLIKLHHSLIKLENEVAMMRTGFNNAVAHYNTRIGQFPDWLLARSFGFKRMSLLSFEKVAHALPVVVMGETNSQRKNENE